MPKTAGIILVGNEILSGKIVDANAAYLCRELREEPREGGVEIAVLLRLQRHLHPILGVRQLRVRPQQQLGKVGEQLVQVRGQRPLPDAHEYALEVEGPVAEPLAERVELLPEDLRHAGQDVDVAGEHGGKP